MYFNPLTRYNLQGMLGPYAPVIYGGQAPATQAGSGKPVGNQTGYQQPMSMMMFAIFQSLMQMMLSMFRGKSGSNGSGNASGGNGYSNQPPAYSPPPSPPVYNYPPPPPVYEKPKVRGSAGLYGDPKFGLFTPNLGNVPAKLKEFESGIKTGQTVTLLKDSDKGGLEIQATGIQVDPNNANSTGIGSVTFKSGSDIITISGKGELSVNGLAKGNINNGGLIAPIKLPSGLTVSTSQEIDGANGQKAERFVITNDEYKITAAARNPHPQATPYLDMNFEELTNTAANNATGYQASIPGITNKFGIPDLLRLEPGDLAVIA